MKIKVELGGGLEILFDKIKEHEIELNENNNTIKDVILIMLEKIKGDSSLFATKEGMLFFETSAKTGDGVINMFFSSFALIDFFNDKRKGDNNDELVKDLIDQNMNEKTRNPIKPVPNDNDIISKNDLIDKNNNQTNNNNMNANNVIKINAENNKSKKQQKKCGC